MCIRDRAKSARKNPRELAQNLRDSLLETMDERKVSSVEIAGPGFINFRFSDFYLADSLSDILSRGPSYGLSLIHISEPTRPY